MSNSLLLSWYGERLLQETEQQHEEGHQSVNDQFHGENENNNVVNNDAKYIAKNREIESIRLEAKPQQNESKTQSTNISQEKRSIESKDNTNNSNGFFSWLPKTIIPSSSWFSAIGYSDQSQNNENKDETNDQKQNEISFGFQPNQQISKWTQWTNYLSSLANVTVKIPEMKPSKCVECAWTSSPIEISMIGFRSCSK
jgi:hypothetical protein